MNIVEEPAEPRLIVDQEPILIRIVSEPFLHVSSRGYQPAVRVYETKLKRYSFLYIGAKSLTDQLEEVRRASRSSGLAGLEFWIRKAGPEKTSPYVVEE